MSETHQAAENVMANEIFTPQECVCIILPNQVGELTRKTDGWAMMC